MNQIATRNAAFSLIELLTVIVVIGILVALTAFYTGRAKEKAKRVQCEGLLRQFYIAVKIYADDNEGYVAKHSEFLLNMGMVCPSDTSGGSIAVFEKTSFMYSTFIFGAKRRFDDIPGNWLLVYEYQPWHDPSKKPAAEQGKWRGRFNTLHADGSLRWPFLEQ